jgi:hypothetical protein
MQGLREPFLLLTQFVHVTPFGAVARGSGRAWLYALLDACTSDVIIVPSGKDATQDFEEIGHSKSARDMLEKYLIGTYAVSSQHRRV